MAQLPQQDAHNENLHIFSTLPNQPIGPDSSEEDNDITQNSVTSRCRSRISNESKTSLKIPSIKSEFCKVDFASFDPAASVSVSRIRHDPTDQDEEEALDENDTSSSNEDVAKKRPPNILKVGRYLKV